MNYINSKFKNSINCISFIYYVIFIPIFFRFGKNRGFHVYYALSFLVFMEAVPAFLYIHFKESIGWTGLAFLWLNILISISLIVTILKVVGIADDRIYNTRGAKLSDFRSENRLYSASDFSKSGRKYLVLFWSLAMMACLYVSIANIIIYYSFFSSRQLACFGDGAYSGYFYTLSTLPPRLDICTEPVADKATKALRYFVNAIVIGSLLTEVNNIAYRKSSTPTKQ